MPVFQGKALVGGQMKNRFAMWIVIGLVGTLAFGIGALAQTEPKAHISIPVIPANPNDVGSIEGIVKASYETISGGVGVPRQWGRDRTLYDPHVRFVAIVKDKKSGGVRAESTDEQEYADQDDAFMVKEGFTERELGQEIHRFGNVATVLSSYEGKVSSTGKVVARGVNIFQLYFDGKRWWILSMAWDEESAENPIPKGLLPKS
jgi:hypothetical protein